MAGERYDFVLEDDLYLEYHKFMNASGGYDLHLVKRILSFYKRNILTNIAQLKRVNLLNNAGGLEKQLRAAGYTTQSLPELANKTLYKIILSKDKSDYPYVNVYSDKIESTISGTFVSGENREKAKSHLAALCGSAQRSIHVLDKFLLSDWNLEWLCRILPTRKVTLFLPDSNFGKIESQMKTLGVQCDICKDSGMMVNSHHDRYIMIDDCLEIVLSGGIDHLVRTQKDFTYLIREVEQNHLIK